MDICSASVQELEYAYNLPQEATYILYEEDCDNITQIKNNFENN